MDKASLLIKFTGALLLIWTARSIYRHVKDRKSQQWQQKHAQQSKSEQVLNNIMLYVWLAFMIAFSTGMMVNN